MYLQGTFIGKTSKIVINKETKESDVKKFLKDNKEMEGIITNTAKIAEQYFLMYGKEMPKPKKKVATK